MTGSSLQFWTFTTSTPTGYELICYRLRSFNFILAPAIFFPSNAFMAPPGRYTRSIAAKRWIVIIMQGCLLVDSHKSTGSGPVRSPVSCPIKKTKNTNQKHPRTSNVTGPEGAGNAVEDPSSDEERDTTDDETDAEATLAPFLGGQRLSTVALASTNTSLISLQAEQWSIWQQPGKLLQGSRYALVTTALLQLSNNFANLSCMEVNEMINFACSHKAGSAPRLSSWKKIFACG